MRRSQTAFRSHVGLFFLGMVAVKTFQSVSLAQDGSVTGTPSSLTANGASTGTPEAEGNKSTSSTPTEASATPAEIPPPPKVWTLEELMRTRGEVAKGEEYSAACAGCHGPSGNSFMASWPKLAGQVSKQTTKQIWEFKAGVRNDPMMSAMAAGIPEENIPHLAAYYAAQMPLPGAPNETLLKLGETLYINGKAGVPACRACHGPEGIGMNGGIPGGAPSVRGQHQEYLVKQLTAFKSGERANDWDSVMRKLCGHLTEPEIIALAEYMNSLVKGAP